MRGALASRDGAAIAVCGCERLLDLDLRLQWIAVTAQQRIVSIDEIYLYHAFDKFYNVLDGTSMAVWVRELRIPWAL
ncbi:hypothetical protein D3C86_2106500 [compost metagenome]